MSDYALELSAARLAQRDYCAAQAHLVTRGKAIARAWAARPGGTTWADLTQQFNEGLPREARLKTSQLRLDEATYREVPVSPPVSGRLQAFTDAVKRGPDVAPLDPCPHPPGWRKSGSHDQMPYCGRCGADLDTGENDALAATSGV